MSYGYKLSMFVRFGRIRVTCFFLCSFYCRSYLLFRIWWFYEYFTLRPRKSNESFTLASCLQVILKVCNLCYLVLMLRFLLCNACTREVNINYKLYLSHISYIGHQTQSKRNLTYTLYYYSNKSIWILLLHRWRAPHKK